MAHTDGPNQSSAERTNRPLHNTQFARLNRLKKYAENFFKEESHNEFQLRKRLQLIDREYVNFMDTHDKIIASIAIPESEQ